MELTKYIRRKSGEVRIGATLIGGSHPIAVQSMTNTATADVEQSVAQVERIADAGAPIVRLTAQGKREGEALADIVAKVREDGYSTAIVADIHFVPEIASIAADSVDKVRINPGNYRTSGGELEALIEKCRKRGVALRIGVNHGSLARHIVDRLGDTPAGMVESAMEFLRICVREQFDQVVVSMKSSNTRVMVHAYRLLVEAMEREGMAFPIHLGVTEAGNGIEGRIKSAVGIGALLADGIGDTIRVSLTEAPANEIPAAQSLVDHYAHRGPCPEFATVDESRYNPYGYSPRPGAHTPILWSEVAEDKQGDYQVVEATTEYPVQEWRSKIVGASADRPIVLRRHYTTADYDQFAIEAAADFGVMFIDSLADGIDIRNDNFSQEQIDEIALAILQAARVRISRTEYIACPSCGRTLYDIESTLAAIKARTSHLVGLKIGVMGCIVNGPGEMADADYGYVGGLRDHISLYRGKTLVERNVPMAEAIDRLIDLIKADGRWVEK